MRNCSFGLGHHLDYKNRFRSWICFRLQVKGWKVDREPIYWASWQSQVLYPLPYFCPKTEAHSSFRGVMLYFVIYTMGKVQKNNFTYYNAPSSETFELRLNISNVIGAHTCLFQSCTELRTSQTSKSMKHARDSCIAHVYTKRNIFTSSLRHVHRMRSGRACPSAPAAEQLHGLC